MALNRNTTVGDIEDSVRIKTDTRNIWWASPVLFLDTINRCTSEIARKLIDQLHPFYIKKSGALTITSNAAPIGTLAYNKMLWCEGNTNAYITLVDVQQLKRAAALTTTYSASVLAAHEGENILYFAGASATADTSIYVHYIAQPTYATARTDKPDLPDEQIQTLIDAVTEEINKYRVMMEKPVLTQDVAEDVQESQASGQAEKQVQANGTA